MTSLTFRMRIVGYSAVIGVAELRALFTPSEWFCGWLLRVLVQALFYGLLGRAIDSQVQVSYLIIGNCVLLIGQESLFVVLSAVLERTQGTLLMLAASPAGAANVYMARGLQWIVSGTFTSTVAIFTLPPLLGVHLDQVRVLAAVPLIVVCGLSVYAYACLLAAIAVDKPSATWIVFNLGRLVIAMLAGVNVPTAFWPQPLRAVTEFLPFTHGLQAIRGVLAGTAGAGQILTDVGEELLVGAAWLTAALLLYRWLVARARHRGTLDIGS
jgi:ABC-2 type transport system permease protein